MSRTRAARIDAIGEIEAANACPELCSTWTSGSAQVPTQFLPGLTSYSST